MLKEIYWKLHGRSFEFNDLSDSILSAMGLQVEQHWCRVVMDRETDRIVKQLKPGTLKALEISGAAWETRCEFREYKSLSYPHYDVCDLPLDESFDLIIAEQVWEHLKWPYRAGRNVHAMLNPEGFFLLTTPFLIRVHKLPLDCSRWTEEGLKYLLAECGFPLDKVRTSSWGNRACLKANLKRWVPYRSWLHSLRNEVDVPLVVWALAQKASN